jgi:hypothetical protein
MRGNDSLAKSERGKSGCGVCSTSLSILVDLRQITITPQRVVAFTATAILIYVFWKGPERFYYEAFGTWIISPSIYVRILPFPLNQWLLSGIRNFPLLPAVLCMAPLLMLSLSFAFAIYSIWQKSLPHAFISLALATTVFSVYHWVQPFGITLIRY